MSPRQSKKEQNFDLSKKDEKIVGIRCTKISLAESMLKILDIENKANPTIKFKINILIRQNLILSQLSTHIIQLTEEKKEKPIKFSLDFDIFGTFIADVGLKPSDLSEFAKLYSLSILWPYAREYASDQFRRVEFEFSSLPIINPQLVTKDLLNKKLIKVDYITDLYSKGTILTS